MVDSWIESDNEFPPLPPKEKSLLGWYLHVGLMELQHPVVVEKLHGGNFSS